MSSRFKPGESVRHGVRRIVRHQLDDLIVQLRAGPERRNAVHEARKHSKKLRAVIRLARDEIGDGRYRSATPRR